MRYIGVKTLEDGTRRTWWVQWYVYVCPGSPSSKIIGSIPSQIGKSLGKVDQLRGNLYHQPGMRGMLLEGLPPLEINITPENHWLQDAISYCNSPFFRAHSFIFPGVFLFRIPEPWKCFVLRMARVGFRSIPFWKNHSQVTGKVYSSSV